MSKWQPIWLVLSFALVYGANRGLAPTLPYEMPAVARTMATGVLELSVGGQAHQLKLVTGVLVVAALQPLLAEAKPVRLLWMRGVEEGEGSDPDVELFVDTIGDGRLPDVSNGDIAPLREASLPVLAVAPGSDARSRVRLPGDSAPRRVRSGSLMVKRVLQVEAGVEGARSRMEGTLQLVLEREGGDPEPVSGRFELRVAR